MRGRPRVSNDPLMGSRSWRYLVPNAITLAGMMLGLMAVVQAVDGDFREACWLIILCALIDKLDGTAARLLKASSPTGAQLDSLADLVTFGIAPGALVYAMLADQRLMAAGFEAEPLAMWTLGVGKIALALLVGAYVMGAALRLARFNVLEGQTAEDSPKVFYGMPTTVAGATLAALMLLAFEYQWLPLLQWAPLVTLGLAVLMNVNVPLPKIARRRSTALNVFQAVNGIAGYICGIARILPEYLAAALVLYALIGFTWGFINREALAPKIRASPG